MGKFNASKHSASIISSAANPKSTSTSTGTNRSSVLKSSFCPSLFQLSLFASVIHGLGSEILRIHDTTTGRLQCEHSLDPEASITCVDWGRYGGPRHSKQHGEVPKKRKHTELQDSTAEGIEDERIVVAYGTNRSQINFYSPLEGKTVGTLKGGHTQGIQDFKFGDPQRPQQAWSIGGDSKIVQWDLASSRALRIVSLPHGPASAIQPTPSGTICASHAAYILKPDSKGKPPTFSASTNAVRWLIARTNRTIGKQMFLTAAENDHFMSVFEETSATIVGSLRTQAEVLQAELFQAPSPKDLAQRKSIEEFSKPSEAVVIVNKDGIAEIFTSAFDFGSHGLQNKAEGTKARFKQRSRKSDTQIRLVRPDKKSSQVLLINASFRENHIITASVEGGVNVTFDMFQWRDEVTDRLLLKDNIEISKKGSGSETHGLEMNGMKDMGKTHLDESRAIVVNGSSKDAVLSDEEGLEVIDISSAEEESDSSTNEATAAPQEDATTASTLAHKDIDMKDASDDDKGEDENVPSGADEPSFGELLRANAPDAVDVQASFPDPNAQSLVPVAERGLQNLPHGMSLGTVLTQSLRTNDRDLLETCFLNKDLSIVRATIERLDSSFAPALLQRLAERLHSRPGRAGSLMVWIQWTLVAHGGYLASQPEVMKNLASLHRVVKQRASSLQSLLSLKGKLDMLEAQMNLRKRMHARHQFNDEDNEEAVVYVEGQDESDSDENSEGEDASDDEVETQRRAARAKQRNLPAADLGGDDSGQEMPMINGNPEDSDDEASNDEDENMFDEEASSTDQDSGDELQDGIDHDDIDTDSSDGEASPQPKKLSTSSKRSQLR
ncbi:uncharacterized protein KY384_004434 [Bacidia gigantensis]|uniref:uncharacterized protein n=1 Tax=Bacidia gigantensis TaxID=2732470 RepID=UPI001D0558C4|nr:uncharacterized protein KY384_004434 [Bacidia gigantensis]KAG8531077.1 hypothetical protein KY384_004434 [Bacidia gigantensis]